MEQIFIESIKKHIRNFNLEIMFYGFQGRKYTLG